ncbi:NUDIX hydrolase [Actinoplanes sp. CA-030573]|uniref:NUDIX hydrolase n=1 Tax=Actinoplanes sp. CA-030573 TaxID=3239898 RepID=UPI003D92479A
MTDTIIATAWVCVRDRHVLVVRPGYTDAFYLPGGKPEEGETYAEAAAREVREEVGIVVDPADLEPFTEIVAPAHNRPPGTVVRLICFTGGGDGQEPAAAAEIGEIAWFTAHDRRRCAPAIQLLVDELAGRGLVH